MTGVAVDKVILTAMGFIRNHHNVVTVGKDPTPGPPFAALRDASRSPKGRGEKFLNGGKEDAACNASLEFLHQVFTAGGLFGRLAQDFETARERPKELIVEVVAIGDDDDGGILHGGMQDQPPRVKRHREALARTLRVPDHADTVVTLFAALHRLG